MSGGAARLAVIVLMILCNLSGSPAGDRESLVEQSVVADRVEIPNMISGQGDPMIRLDGGLSSASSWTIWTPHLPDAFQVIDIGSRGRDSAKPHARPFTYTVTVADVIEVMDDLGRARADLVG